MSYPACFDICPATQKILDLARQAGIDRTPEVRAAMGDYSQVLCYEKALRARAPGVPADRASQDLFIARLHRAGMRLRGAGPGFWRVVEDLHRAAVRAHTAGIRKAAAALVGGGPA